MAGGVDTGAGSLTRAGAGLGGMVWKRHSGDIQLLMVQKTGVRCISGAVYRIRKGSGCWRWYVVESDLGMPWEHLQMKEEGDAATEDEAVAIVNQVVGTWLLG